MARNSAGFRFGIAMLALAAAAQARAGTPLLAAAPGLPNYGQAVQIEVQSDWPVYLRTMRYSRSGGTVTIDYDYLVDGFGPTRPDLGTATLPLGELPPGDYALKARFFDLAHPGSAPQIITSSLPVAPPIAWGVYSVPQQPGAFEPVDVVIHSAAYYDPASLRATVTGTTVRVDFDYYGDAPTNGAYVPPGATSSAAVRVGGLAPGLYHIEGWGRPMAGGSSQRYFTLDVTIGTVSRVVEFYAMSLDHYFVSASPDEIAALDSGAQPGWQRTGQKFNAWMRAGDAPVGAAPVCRFYTRGANSHFYTIDPGECTFLRNLEQAQRADAARSGTTFTGWEYEGIAFYSVPPQNGQCPGGTDPVYRAYNGQGSRNDSNHRFTIDGTQHAMMLLVWADEGVAFCSPH